MGRDNKARKRERKARNAAIRRGEGPPRRPTYPLDPADHEDVHGPIRWRDPRTRWLYLSARGGARLSFVPTSLTVPVNMDSPEAPEALRKAVVEALQQAPTVDAFED